MTSAPGKVSASDSNPRPEDAGDNFVFQMEIASYSRSSAIRHWSCLSNHDLKTAEIVFERIENAILTAVPTYQGRCRNVDCICSYDQKTTKASLILFGPEGKLIDKTHCYC